VKNPLDGLDPVARRRFLKLMGAALAAPAIPSAIKLAANDLVRNAAAAPANAADATYLIEVNLRDQWDQGHIFVAPGLATHSGLRRGTNGRAAAIFFQQGELTRGSTGVYLTPDSRVLEPYLDTIAMIDCCELSRGAIHGHESANALRSPGRTYTSGNGRVAMYKNDPISNFPQGCEAFYSSTPTPASLHNFVQKGLDPALRNGIAFKGISRSIHTCYHFAAGLAGAELDRIQSRNALFQAFPESVQDLNVMPTAAEADLFARIVGKVDPKFLAARRHPQKSVDGHTAAVEEAKNLLHSGMKKVVSLPLTAEEETFWKTGVPNGPGGVKGQIWEQFAWAFKLVSNRLVSSVALEFDYVDTHDSRDAAQLAIETKQCAISLARLITKLKEAGIYDRTLIAIYTTDGSRSPAAGSSGDEGKNTIILAGGMIKGGYYGDIRVAGDDGNGHRYSFHAPDPVTGAPGMGYTNNDGRLPGSVVWRTVMKALRVPDDVCAKFPDVANAKPMPFLLRT
jgi:hypothetical protein